MIVKARGLSNRRKPVFLYGKEGVKKLPYQAFILTETQYRIVAEGGAYFEKYGDFVTILPDIQNSVSSNAAISMECSGASIRAIKYSYLNLQPGGHSSVECTIKSDMDGYYTWLGLEIAIDDLETPVVFIKPLYVNKEEMKIFVFSEFDLENRDVRMF